MTEQPKLTIVSTEAMPDPFDLANLRLGQDFTETVGVKKVLMTVPVHKPRPQDFVRVHLSPVFRGDFPMIVLKDEDEIYIVARGVVAELATEIVSMSLFTAVNRQGVCFLWPVRLPSADGRQQEWHRSAREAAEMAVNRWVRTKANRSLGAYEIHVAEGVMAEPVWPDVDFAGLIKLAFRDRIVDSLEHPVVKRLRGLA
jgi:hypothetical protein